MGLVFHGNFPAWHARPRFSTACFAPSQTTYFHLPLNSALGSGCVKLRSLTVISWCLLMIRCISVICSCTGIFLMYTVTLPPSLGLAVSRFLLTCSLLRGGCSWCASGLHPFVSLCWSISASFTLIGGEAGLGLVLFSRVRRAISSAFWSSSEWTLSLRLFAVASKSSRVEVYVRHLLHFHGPVICLIASHSSSGTPKHPK